MTSLKTLVVDDDRNMRLAAKFVLEHHGFVVDVATNGLEGIALAHQCSYDFILFDIGEATVSRNDSKLIPFELYNAVRIVRERQPNALIIGYSGFPNTEAQPYFDELFVKGDRKIYEKIEEILSHHGILHAV